MGRIPRGLFMLSNGNYSRYDINDTMHWGMETLVNPKRIY